MKTWVFLGTFLTILMMFSCGTKDNVATVAAKPKSPVKKVQIDTTAVKCNLKMNDIIGNYANKSGFSATIKVSEKDSTKIDFVFQISKGCPKRYSGTASREDYLSENELNYIYKYSENKVAREISMFFSEGKLSIAESTSEKKDSRNDKCLFEGHLTKLK